VQIRNLEMEIGVELFARNGRSVALSEAGRCFMAEARTILGLAERSADMARRAAKGEIGRLSIGYNNPAGFRIFPHVIPSFARLRPHVHLTMLDLRAPQQIDGLRRGELDIGFVWLPIPTAEFDMETLVEEPLVAALPAAHSLAGQTSVSAIELSGEPLVLPARQADPENFREYEMLFHRAGAVMNVAYELESLLSIANFVAMGLGCGILPEYARIIAAPGIVYRPLRDEGAARTLAIIKRAGKDDLVTAFFDFTVGSIQGVRNRSSDRQDCKAR
jgi:DNA-binding transcriptional LysR family regulator